MVGSAVDIDRDEDEDGEPEGLRTKKTKLERRLSKSHAPGMNMIV